MSETMSPIAVEPPERQRWALATDGLLDDRAVEELGRCSAHGLVAVLVAPLHYEHAHVSLAGVARCATHPKELEAIDVKLCFAWNGDEIIARHGGELRTFAEVITL